MALVCNREALERRRPDKRELIDSFTEESEPVDTALGVFSF